MTCTYPGCSAAATHVYALDDHAADPAYYCADHAPGLATRLGRIAGVGRPGATPPGGPTVPAGAGGVRRCRNCDKRMRRGASRRHGRCEACSRYLDRTGYERPASLFGPGEADAADNGHLGRVERRRG